MNTVLLEGPKRALLDFIKRRGEVSLELAIQQIDLAKTTVRQHLLSLENQGLIRRKYERSGQGRPKLLFELSQEGQRLYPTQEPVLLRELLEHLKASGQQSVIETFFEKYWAKRRLHFEAILSSLESAGPASPQKNPLEARLEALRRLLEAEGFMPEIEIGPGHQFKVSECNCPFREAIHATQLPCKLESDFVRWALKTNPSRTSYIPKGDNACTYSRKAK